MARIDSPIYISPIKENYSKISTRINNRLKIDSKYDLFENKGNRVNNSANKFKYFELKKFDDFYFSKSNYDEINNQFCLNKNEIISIAGKCSDCNVCKATENLLANFIKSNKDGKSKTEEMAKMIYFEEEKPVDYRKINLEEFKKKRDKYKSIISVKNSCKLPSIEIVYSPNYHSIKKRSPCVKFQPVSDKEKNVFRDDQSPKILRSLNNSSLNVTLNDKDNMITRLEKKFTKSSLKISRNKQNYSSINLDELPLIYNNNISNSFHKEQGEQFRKNLDYEYKKNYQRITNGIDKEYQNFLENLNKSSRKCYNTILKDTLAKQKYRETEKRREQKIQQLKNKKILNEFDNKFRNNN